MCATSCENQRNTRSSGLKKFDDTQTDIHPDTAVTYTERFAGCKPAGELKRGDTLYSSFHIAAESIFFCLKNVSLLQLACSVIIIFIRAQEFVQH